MPRSYTKWLMDNTYKTFLVRFCCLTIIPFLFSCSNDIVLQDESKFDSGSSFETKYSMIFVIHSDGDYLYHDTSNNEYNADEEVLLNVKKVAMENPNAEVFIFHQKPRSNFLFLFPLRDGEFYYYRNGQLIANELYWRDQDSSNFDFEIAAYDRFHTVNQNKLVRMFLYFGHEIPEFGGTGYDESYPDRKFTIENLTTGLNGFTSDSSKFDLAILGTCFGGTPYTINKLGSYSKIIIASPENLHLSYYDLHPLEQLDFNLKDGDIQSFAKNFALQSFERLSRNVQTEVSVVVYEVEKVQTFLNSIYNDYDTTLISLNGMTHAILETINHCDCADIPAYRISTINSGVDVLYRPARFGRSKNKLNHSGWECWKY
jgi:hypothetical protein